jgi:predicted MFS family arabinose efflux permease
LVAWLLAAAYTLAFVDRQILNLLIDPVRRTLEISDTQVSLLQGAAFSTAYILFTPLFGRLADRGRRNRVLLLGTLVWCICTVGCGLSGSFEWLFVFRFGIGAAEACVSPIAWSLLADYFSREQLPRALSIYLMGPYLGAGLALIFGGALLGKASVLSDILRPFGALEPWQATLVVVGLAGLAVVALLFLVREPPRRGDPTATAAEPPSLRQIAAFFWGQRAFFGRFYAAMAMIVIVLYALPTWMPTVLSRRFDESLSKIGLEYGLIVLFAGTAGVLTGPMVNTWLRTRSGSGSQVTLAAGAAAALVPTTMLLPLAPTYYTTLVLAGVITFLFSLPQATSASALQMAAPARMRGVAAAIYVFIVSVVGLGIAPLLVALITDRVFGDPARLSTSLAIVCAISAVGAAWLAARALPYYRRMVVEFDQEAKREEVAAG